MKLNRKPTLSMLEHAQKTFVRSRPGSVLILVIALLVLMALIGTAYMSMAQADRTTSVQHENNTEIDLLMDGLANILKGSLTSELYNQGYYRPGQGYNAAAGTASYEHYTGVGADASRIAFLGLPLTVNPGNRYVAARAPELQQEVGTTPNPLLPNNPVTWSFITAPLIGGQFSSPLPATGKFLDGQTLQFPNNYTQRSTRYEPAPFPPLVPGSYPTNPNLPAWVNPANLGEAVLAADADGDGIADSGFIKLPIGSINGVTYYAAFRIVDSNSAVNVNTAWQHNPQTGIGTQGSTLASMPGDFFPSSIDLSPLAVGADQGLTLLLNRRFAFPATVPLPATSWSAYDDSTLLRADLTNKSFNNALEASWTQLGRRINNPGYVDGVKKFNPYQRSDGLYALIHNFVVRDGTVLPSNLEWDLINSLQNVAISPYAASNSTNWYLQNFSFLGNEFQSAAQNPVPLRAFLTTENPVSNFAPNTYRDRQVYDSRNTYLFGDSVLGLDGHRYVCINPPNATATPPPVLPAALVPPGTPYAPLPNPIIVGPAGGPQVAQSQSALFDNDTWVQMPWLDAPTKISVNTGTFGQLWLAYWSVMANQVNNVVAGASVIQSSAPFPSTPPTPTAPLSARMFRSPLRIAPPVGTPALATGPAPYFLSPHQVMQLRAALAAVNTIDMRDNDDDVTSRQVALVPAIGEPASFSVVYATVFGQEMQPFITEVYATNQPGPNPVPGYVAIKLFNPYNVALSLANYRIGYIARDNNAVAADLNRTIVEVTPDTPTFWTSGTAPVIPAHGFIIISSLAGNGYTGGGNTLSLPTTVVPGPAPAGSIGNYTMTNLVNALNNDVVILRPRQGFNGAYGAAGNLTSTPNPPIPHTPVGTFTEPGGIGGADLSQMVPVDSYDFTGLQTGVANDVPVEWHYLRPSDQPGAGNQLTSWHWVYPGHYRFAAPNVSTPSPYPLEAVAGALGTAPRLVDGTHVGTFPGGSFKSPNILIVPASITPTPAGPNELWTMGQVGFSPSIESNPAANVYVDIPLRLNTPDSAGPNNAAHMQGNTVNPELNGFPFGGFARNGDILQVPFIGSYTLKLPAQIGTTSFLEMNPVTMDAMMALGTAQPNWNEATSDVETSNPAPPNANADPLFTLASLPRIAVENVGHFAPIDGVDLAGSSSAIALNDYSPLPQFWRYHFGMKLFDFLTVQSPQQDTFPDVDPQVTDLLNNPNLSLPYKYPFSTTGSPYNFALPVANSNAVVTNAERGNTPPGTTEQSVGVHGLVNINTAPWRVLAAVPWFPPSTNAINDNGPRTLNAAVAMSIVFYRDVNDGTGTPHGPFKNIFELNNVPIYANGPFSGGAIPPGTLFKNLLLATPPYNTGAYNDLTRGNLQAAYTTGNIDVTQGDFQSQQLMLNRVSNLITTRSDHFVAYILLQGWTGAETTNATMVVQRRAAYIIDRTNVVGNTNSIPSMSYVPNN